MSPLINYSVVIRTLGNTGEKYLRLLDAISKQTITPHEVIVVLPFGYSLDHLLGGEKVFYSEKGMVSQRAKGIAEASGDYLLVVDDDLDLPPDFVEKMYDNLKSQNLDCALAFGGNANDVGNDKRDNYIRDIKQYLHKLRRAFTGQVFYSQRNSKWFDVIASTGGHRTYVNNPRGLCQAGAGGCCFIKRERAQQVHFEDEAWLDQGILYQYSSYEDAVFFYKLFLSGGRIAYTQDTFFIHLDAAAGRPAKKPIEARRIRLYTIARNRTIFWRKLIYGRHRSLKNLLGGWYGIINYGIYNILINLHPKRWPAIAALLRGYADAFSYIRSQRL